MLTADQGDRFPKSPAVHVDQHVSMLLLNLGHIIEDFCGLRILRAQMIGIGAVDAGIVFFGRDGKCEDFLFAKRGERAFGQGKRLRNMAGTSLE
ncbi:hypothetical protein X971_0248 [Agrobacterium tumefaciens LBA4213 (Ach5)]|nr:hypothetical protein X971_0248 [Agrobacterium tumefaciens LBA4213 (Ach5)]